MKTITASILILLLAGCAGFGSTSSGGKTNTTTHQGIYEPEGGR
ncbi:hypothetical protein [Noviherbaspirillum galbum]|nr:hypothetical protein [Noviherbaspirillum galbum]